MALLSETPGLIAFVRTVETGSFSAAARDLGTTPSATSKSVARLERRLDAKLFLRSTRTLTLTPEGQAFFDRVAPLLQEIERSADVVQLSKGLRGRLRVSLPSEIARILMDSILVRFLASYPHLNLDLDVTDRFVELIREDYDVAFRIGRVAGSDLTVRTLAQLDMVLVVSPSFVKKWGTPQSIDDLRKMPFARYTMGRRAHEVRFANGTSIAVRGQVGFDTGFGLRSAALQGVGIAHVTRCIVEEDLRRGELVIILPEQPLPPVPFQAFHAFGRQVPLRVQVLTDFIAREIKSVIRDMR
jgi:DNA-binding transcriptional LysR family regulator